jgi:Zn-dependent metalloprotease
MINFLRACLTSFILLTTLPFAFSQNDQGNGKKIKIYNLEDALKAPEAQLISGENTPHNQYLPLNKVKTGAPFNLFSRNLLQDSSIKIARSSDTRLPIFITTPANALLPANINAKIKKSNVSETVKDLSFSYLKEISPITKMFDPINQFSISSIESDELGYIHIRMQEVFKGVKIYGGEVVIHLSKNGRGIRFNGNYDIISSNLDLTAKVSGSIAIQNAINHLSRKTPIQKLGANESKLLNYTLPIIDTVIYKKSLVDSYALTYHITIRPNIIQRFEYFVDAQTGNILNSFESSCTIDGPRTSNAIDLNGVSRTINSYLTGSTYSLVDATKSMYNATTQSGILITLDKKNTFGTNETYDEITNSTNAWTNPTAVSAHFNAGVAFDYFKKNHDRNSIDGNGGNVISIINVVDPITGKSMANAGWNGVMSYGNGDSDFKPFAGSLDVAGHEMTHGVVEKTAGLDYNGQSGAINESMADIFGCMMDSTNWTIGETIVKNTILYKSGALRSLKDPHNGGTSSNDDCWQPNHMNEYFYGSSDHFGVHTNSGIPNYAFYLLANSTVGRYNASKIFYRALTKDLTKYSKFIDLRLAVIQAAKELFPTTDANIQAAASFDAVGIYDATSQKSNASKTILPNPGNGYLLSVNTDPSNLNGIYRSYTSGTGLTPLAGKVANNKISIADNGQYGVYIGTDKKMYSIITNPASTPTISVIQSQPIWSNVVVSKDGKRIAAVTSNADTSIWMYDFSKTKWFRFKLYSPSYTEGVKLQGPVYADGLDWDHNGEYIIYDCFNSLKKSTGASAIENWDINGIHVWDLAADSAADGSIFKVFDLGDGENVGNPSLSKNSPYIMAFDYLNTTTNEYYVAGYNFEFDELGAIYKNNTYSYPSYNRTDDTLAFTSIDANSKYIVNTIKLNSDKISSPSLTANKILSTSKWPTYYTVGTRSYVTPPPPSISITGSTSVCAGSKVMLKSSANSGNQWYLNGVVLKDSVAATIYASVSGSYTVITTQGTLSSDASNPVLVTIKSLPAVPTVTAASTVTFCIGGNVMLSSSAGVGNQWYKDGVNISGAVNTTYTANTSGVYTVITTANGCSSSPSTATTVTVNPKPSAPVTSALSVCEGGTASTLTATAITGNNLRWYGTSATGGTASTSAPTASSSLAGVTNYYVSQISTQGCESDRSILVFTVNPKPSVPVTVASAVCIGGAVTALSATASNNNSLRWYGTNATGGTSSTSAPTVSSSVIGVTNYYVSQVNALGCESDRSVLKHTVNPLPTKPVISWSGVQFATTATGVNYQWLLNGVVISGATAATHKPLNTGDFKLRITDPNGCVNVSDSFNLVVTAIGNLATTPASNIATIYPNPASTQVVLEFATLPAINLSFQIVSQSGKVLSTITGRNKINIIDVSDLQSGNYFINVIGKKYDQVKKVLIQK